MAENNEQLEKGFMERLGESARELIGAAGLLLGLGGAVVAHHDTQEREETKHAVASDPVREFVDIPAKPTHIDSLLAEVSVFGKDVLASHTGPELAIQEQAWQERVRETRGDDGLER